MRALFQKTLFLIVVISSICLAEQSESVFRYPNELKGYKLYNNAVWKRLRPLESSSADVDKVLGAPNPVFRGNDEKWNILVHFVGEKSECNGKFWPQALTGKLNDITLIPKTQVSFLNIEFPKAFKKSEWYSAHAIVQADGYSDQYGLTYYVYRDNSPDGNIQKGDLKAIVYSYSQKSLAEKAGCK